MKLRLLHLISMLSCLCLLGQINQAYADSLPEYTIKTTYLYNFALLTEWPKEAPEGTFNICILGRDNFGPALDALRGKNVNNKPIQTRHIQSSIEASECHLVFIGNTDRYRTTQMIRELANLPVLTVTDEMSLSNDGAMILLYPEKQRMVFDINLSVAKQANLNLSARLLRLARRVVSQ